MGDYVKEETELQALRSRYPYRVRIIAWNPFHIPLGKKLLYGRRKEGSGSPYPIEAFSFAGSYQRYQFTDAEAVLELPTEGGGASREGTMIPTECAAWARAWGAPVMCHIIIHPRPDQTQSEAYEEILGAFASILLAAVRAKGELDARLFLHPAEDEVYRRLRAHAADVPAPPEDAHACDRHS